jgi:formylglycine-generating enzyme
MRLLGLFVYGAALAVISHQIGAQPIKAFKDCELCPEMVAIPPGRVLVGMPRGMEEKFGIPAVNRKRSEPVTEVIIGYRFGVGRFEVTRGQFAAFVQETKYSPVDSTGCWAGYGRPAVPVNHRRRAIGRPDVGYGLSWSDPGFAQTDDHPVVCVSLDDINKYLGWISQKAGRNYRLLSESEWNYVVGGGIKTAWPWGDDAAGACGYGNFSDLTRALAEGLDITPDNEFQCFDGFVNTAPVGSFAPNKLGIYDLAGNVMEVLADCFQDDLESLPRDGSPYVQGNCALRSSKGGSWDSFPFATLTGYRSIFDARPGQRYTFAGFRLAVTLAP